jgi:hypothetical protein
MAGVGRTSGEGEEERLPELEDKFFSILTAGAGGLAARSGRTVPYVYNGILSRSS